MRISPLPRALFIDDGGTLNDNRLRAAQWQRFVGEFMAPRLGGGPLAWAEANRDVFPRVWAAVGARMHAFATHREYQRAYDLAWIGAMCERVGVPAPPEASALELARGAAEYVSARVRAPIAGAPEAVRALHAAGFALYTASGTPSWELENSLALLGLRGCFGRVFGPDLVDVPKGGPGFYRRVFAHVGADPATALVVDDSADACRWAHEAGARAVRIDGTDEGAGEMTARSLAELAARLT